MASPLYTVYGPLDGDEPCAHGVYFTHAEAQRGLDAFIADNTDDETGKSELDPANWKIIPLKMLA